MTGNVCTSFFSKKILFLQIVRHICCGADIYKDYIVTTTNHDSITEYIQSITQRTSLL